jgi:hypothetical protein
MRDLRANSLNLPNEVLPKEKHVRCALYSYLKRRGCTVHEEATYPESGQKCDLRVRFPNTRKEWWIEIKMAWSLDPAWRWNNKPTEQRAKWDKDVQKLRKAPASAVRIFVLFCISDRWSSPRGGGIPEQISDFHPAKIAYVSPKRKFRWGNPCAKNLQAWAWYL